MVLSCCTISLLGILGLNLIDSVYAQYGTYSTTPKTEKMTGMSENKPMEKNMESHKVPPIKQIRSGVLPQDVQCNDNLQLIFSPSSKNPACVKQSTMETLVVRGWLTVDNLMMTENTQTSETKTIEISAKEVDETYRWSGSDGTNPTINIVANTNNVIQITNPTDVKHEFVIESNGEEVVASGDIAPDGSGKMSFTPTTSGVFGYHCEYHPDTMKGTINVS
jgi:plastocyanin